jgi:hypothetical protein
MSAIVAIDKQPSTTWAIAYKGSGGVTMLFELMLDFGHSLKINDLQN